MMSFLLGFGLAIAAPPAMIVRVLSVREATCLCHDGATFRAVPNVRGCQITFVSEGEMWQTEALHQYWSMDTRICGLRRGSRTKVSSEIASKMDEKAFRTAPTCAEAVPSFCRANGMEKPQRLRLSYLEEMPAPFSFSWTFYSLLHPSF